MGNEDHWATQVRSWTVKVADKIKRIGNENGARTIRSHSGSGSLGRTGPGMFEGRLTASEYEEVVHGTGAATKTTAEGSERWDVELQVSPEGYVLEIGLGSGDVPAKTEAIYVNQIHRYETTIPWRVGKFTGPLPASPGPIKG